MVACIDRITITKLGESAYDAAEGAAPVKGEIFIWQFIIWLINPNIRTEYLNNNKTVIEDDHGIIHMWPSWSMRGSFLVLLKITL